MTTPEGRTPHSEEPAEGSETPGEDEEEKHRHHAEDPAEGREDEPE